MKEKKLEKLWLERHRGDFAAAKALYLDYLKSEKLFISLSGATSVERRYEELSQVLSDNDFLRVYLFEVSLLSEQAKFKEALEEIEHVERYFQLHSKELSAFFYFQKAIYLLSQRKNSESYNLFNRVKESKKGLYQHERVLTDLNLILAQLDLGIDVDSDLQSFAKKNKEFIAKEKVLLRSYFTILWRKSFFKENNLKKVMALPENAWFSSQMSSEYLFARVLPYVNWEQSAQKTKKIHGMALKNLALTELHSLQQYRLHSYQENFGFEEDFKKISFESKIHRLYLWVWRWFLDPSEARLERIHRQLRVLLEGSVSEIQVSKYSLRLLELSLSWLELYSPHYTKVLELLLKKVTQVAAVEEPVHLRFEALLLQYKKQVLLGEHLLAEDTAVLLEKFIQEHNEHSFYRELSVTLKKLFVIPPFEKNKKNQIQRKKSLCVVDGHDFSIQIYREGQESVSFSDERSYLSLRCFQSQKRVSLDAFYAQVFQSHYFDEYLHRPKLANFLVKLNKKLEGLLHFSIKNSSLLCQVKTNVVLDFVPICPRLEMHMKKQAYLVDLLKKYSQLELSKPLQRESSESAFEAKKLLQRSDIEKKLKLSKASANRKIKQWIREKKLVKSGLGKATRYELKEDVFHV